MARKRIKKANFFTKVFKDSYYKLLKKFSNLDLPIKAVIVPYLIPVGTALIPDFLRILT